jgi:hypothetical protein
MSYTRRFYVIFEPRDHISWWNWFLDKEIYHCYLVTYGNQNNTIELNTSVAGYAIRFYNVNLEDWILGYINTTGNKMIIEARTQDMVKPRIKGFKTCVSIIKDYLGINKFGIITSKQLYKYLRRNDNE